MSKLLQQLTMIIKYINSLICNFQPLVTKTHGISVSYVQWSAQPCAAGAICMQQVQLHSSGNRDTPCHAFSFIIVISPECLTDSTYWSKDIIVDVTGYNARIITKLIYCTSFSFIIISILNSLLIQKLYF